MIAVTISLKDRHEERNVKKMYTAYLCLNESHAIPSNDSVAETTAGRAKEKQKANRQEFFYTVTIFCTLTMFCFCLSFYFAKDLAKKTEVTFVNSWKCFKKFAAWRI